MRETSCLKIKTIAPKSFLFLGFFAIISLSAIAQQAPGGVLTNLKLWLKADAGTGTATDGADVTSWLDNSPASNTITSAPSPALQPKYVVNSTNYNPGILYGQGALHTFPGTKGLYATLNSTAFIAGIPLAASSSSDFHNAFASDDGYEYPLNQSINVFGHYDAINGNGFYPLPWEYGEFAFAKSVMYPTGDIDVSKAGGEASNIPGAIPISDTSRYMLIGGDTGESGFGIISEAIVYDDAGLNSTELQQIDSYLGMKYGIVLQDEFATNFLLSDGTTQVWAADADYLQNVLTLVRDDASGLAQKQAHIANDDFKMYVGTLATTNAGNSGTISVDRSAIVVANNTSPVEMTTEIPIPSPVLSRFQKTWKIENTNFTDNFTMEIRWDSAHFFDMTAFRLLTATDPNDFSSAIVSSPTFTNSGNTLIISGITSAMVPSGTPLYFSIGSTTLSTLPVAMTFSAAVTPDSKVALNWQTTSEINNNYFTAERSVDAQSWEVVTKVNGAVNSSTVKNYSFVDKNPYTGVSYYRIKQTDLDGKYSYSKVKTVKVDKNRSALLTMYPNPVSGTLYIKGAATELAAIRIFNMTGVDVTTLVKIIETTSSGKVLDVSRLSAGNYNIKTATAVTKLIKQ